MDEHPTVLRFRARDFPAAQRRAVLQENFCRGVLNIDFIPVVERLDFEIETRWLSDVTITRGYNSGHLATNYDRSRDRDDYLLVWSTDGGHVTHLNRELESRHSAAFLCAAEHIRAQSATTLQHRTVRMPRHLIQHLLPDADDRLARPIAINSDVFRLLHGYFELLFAQEHLTEPTAAQFAADHLCELVAHLARGALGATELDASGGVRAARLAAIKQWALQRLNEPDLSVSAAAAAHRLSPRYVQMLFNAEHSTFSDFVRAERLALARRRLANPRLQHLSISAIAFDVGFSDLSHFNRCFRAAYDQTPSEVRDDRPAPAER